MSYHFHARNAHFFVAAAADFHQQILDVLLQAKPHTFDCIIVAQCRTSDGHQIEASVLSKDVQLEVNLKTSLHQYIIRGYNDEGDTKQPVYDDDEVDDDCDIGEMEQDGRVAPLKYEVYLRFQSAPGIRDRRWAYNLLDRSPQHSPLIAACSVPTPVLDDTVIVDLMQRSDQAIFGKPTLTRKAVLHLLNRRFAVLRDRALKGRLLDDDRLSSVLACVRKYYSDGDNEMAAERLFKEWKMANDIPVNPVASSSRPPRLQQERACPRWTGTLPFRALPSATGRAWMQENITGLSSFTSWEERLGDRRKTLIVCSPSRGIGKTKWAQSFGTHIYMKDVLNRELLHDCMHDKEAEYIVLDDIPWSKLLDKRQPMGASLLGGQASCTWRDGRRDRGIPLGLPVIVLTNDLPSPKQLDDWEGRFVIVKLKPGRKMYSVKPMPDDPASPPRPVQPIVVAPSPRRSLPPPRSPPLPNSPRTARLAFPLDATDITPRMDGASFPHVLKSFFDDDVPKPIHTDAPPAVSPPSSQPLPPRVDATSPPPPTRSSSSPLLQSSSPSLFSSSSPSLATSCSPRRDRLRRTIAQRQLEALVFNKANKTHYGPDSYLITDWLTKEDADRQLTAWEKLHSQFRLMKHRGNPLARYKAFYCDPLAHSRTMYEYTSSELESWEEHDWPPEGLLLRDAVRATLSEDTNSLVANDYRHRKHKIGWHFDKPADIAHGTAIATASLGHARLFQLCPTAEVQRWMDDTKARTKKMEENKELGIDEKLPPVAPLAGVIDIVLPHGSLFVIGPETNEHYMHCIPVSKEKCGRRYGLTFRTIASRWLPDVEVVIRQPPKGETAWDVVHRPKEIRGGKATGQNGYAYRSRIHMEPYTPRDPTRLTEEDIIAVRESMPSRRRMRGRPSRTEKLAPQPDEAENALGEEEDHEESKEEDDVISEEDDNEISEEEDDEESEEEEDEKSEEEDDEIDEEEDSESSEGDDNDSSEEEEPTQKRSKRKNTEQTKEKSKKQRKAAESDDEDA